MEFSIKQSNSEKQRSACVVVGVFAGGKLSLAAQSLDKAAHNALSEVITQDDMTGKLATTLLLPRVAGIVTERVLLVGLGKASEFSTKQFLDVVRATFAALHKTPCKDAALFLSDLAVKGRDEAWKIKQLVLLGKESAFRCDHLKSAPSSAATLKKILLGCAEKPSSAAQTTLLQSAAIADGMTLTKTLGNLPGNICTPTYLAEQAKKLAKTYPLKATVLEEKDMEKLGMFSLLSVSRGSREPAKLITLEYHGGDKKQAPIVLVGKGITFDSGGISLKPGPEMDEMKYDMCGAASVLGTMQAIAAMELKLNVVAIIPSSENLPDGAASKPGDIV
ncbi:MAG: leucyl aminopeptidase, partial [Gallionella sp.]